MRLSQYKIRVFIRKSHSDQLKSQRLCLLIRPVFDPLFDHLKALSLIVAHNSVFFEEVSGRLFADTVGGEEILGIVEFEVLLVLESDAAGVGGAAPFEVLGEFEGDGFFLGGEGALGRFGDVDLIPEVIGLVEGSFDLKTGARNALNFEILVFDVLGQDVRDLVGVVDGDDMRERYFLLLVCVRWQLKFHLRLEHGDVWFEHHRTSFGRIDFSVICKHHCNDAYKDKEISHFI